MVGSLGPWWPVYSTRKRACHHHMALCQCPVGCNMTRVTRYDAICCVSMWCAVMQYAVWSRWPDLLLMGYLMRWFMLCEIMTFYVAIWQNGITYDWRSILLHVALHMGLNVSHGRLKKFECKNPLDAFVLGTFWAVDLEQEPELVDCHCKIAGDTTESLKFKCSIACGGEWWLLGTRVSLSPTEARCINLPYFLTDNLCIHSLKVSRADEQLKATFHWRTSQTSSNVCQPTN